MLEREKRIGENQDLIIAKEGIQNLSKHVDLLRQDFHTATEKLNLTMQRNLVLLDRNFMVNFM